MTRFEFHNVLVNLHTVLVVARSRIALGQEEGEVGIGGVGLIPFGEYLDSFVPLLVVESIRPHHGISLGDEFTGIAEHLHILKKLRILHCRIEYRKCLVKTALLAERQAVLEITGGKQFLCLLYRSRSVGTGIQSHFNGLFQNGNSRSEVLRLYECGRFIEFGVHLADRLSRQSCRGKYRRCGQQKLDFFHLFVSFVMCVVCVPPSFRPKSGNRLPAAWHAKLSK